MKVEGNRHFNAAWHQAFDMRNMLIVSEAMARAALMRKESRGGHAREDFPDMDKGHLSKVNIVAAKHRERDAGRRSGASRTSRKRSRPSSRRVDRGRRAELAERADEESDASRVPGRRERGKIEPYEVETYPGMVVLDAIHDIQAKQEPTLAVRWNCKAGRCGSCSAEINGKPKLMCMTRMTHFPEGEPITVTPMRAFPIIKDLVTDVS